MNKPIEEDEELRTLALHIDALLANRVGARTVDEHKERLDRVQRLQYIMGERVYSRIKRILDEERKNA